MRKFVFRGKRTDNGEWVESHSIINLTNADEPGIWVCIGSCKCGEVYVDDAGNVCHILMKDEPMFYKVDPKTVGQFVGMSDKNGKKIFEGDIVKIDEHDQFHHTTIFNKFHSVNGTYEIFYDGANHCWSLRRDAAYHYHFLTFSDLNGFAETSEVIGNIHDNPELQKE